MLTGGQVLVTAELVANRTYVELEKAASAEKSPAEVVVVDYDCNLALIRPANPDFLKDAKPLQLDSGARVGDKISILQFESNGQIADTPGVITTITVAGYPLDHRFALDLPDQRSASEPRGKFHRFPRCAMGRFLGLLMRYDARSQTADVIPAPVISHFLADANLESYPGFPAGRPCFYAPPATRSFADTSG